ncbi:MAG: recombinase NinG [Candidatus Scalindua sp.]|nr:recombinase NinG [Candidatus Scalindua sp.]
MANSKRKCKNCGERVRDYIVLNNTAFCSFESAVEYASKNKHKGAEIARKEQKKKDVKRKKELKSASDYIKEAQAAVNKYIRLRDRNKPCVSCGSNPKQKHGGSFDAGHYRSRGSASHLRFNILNIHKQCVKCNRFNSGNAVDYRIELIKRIGEDNVISLENNNNPRKFSIEYLQRVKAIFNKRARFYSKRE